MSISLEELRAARAALGTADIPTTGRKMYIGFEDREAAERFMGKPILGDISWPAMFYFEHKEVNDE